MASTTSSPAGGGDGTLSPEPTSPDTSPAPPDGAQENETEGNETRPAPARAGSARRGRTGGRSATRSASGAPAEAERATGGQTCAAQRRRRTARTAPRPRRPPRPRPPPPSRPAAGSTAAPLGRDRPRLSVRAHRAPGDRVLRAPLDRGDGQDRHPGQWRRHPPVRGHDDPGHGGDVQDHPGGDRLLPPHGGLRGADVRRGQDPRRVSPARDAPAGRGRPDGAPHRPPAPAPVPQGDAQRRAGGHHHPLLRSGERPRAPGYAGRLPGPAHLGHPLERPRGGRAHGPRGRRSWWSTPPSPSASRATST